MNQVVTQIKISLPLVLKNEVKKRADRWGMTLASYIKYLMVNKVEEEYPTFEASDRVKKRVADSVSGKSKSIEVKDLKDFFDKL